MRLARIVLVPLLLGAVLVAQLDGQNNRSATLRPGINQTRQALDQVSQLLDENQTKLLELKLEVQKSLTPDGLLKDAFDVFDVGANSFEATKAFQNSDYKQGIGQTAEAVAAIWGQTNPWVGGGRAY